jgi:hypothetical protein
MNTQPEAIRLADWIDTLKFRRPDHLMNCTFASQELRRLHETNRELLNALKKAESQIIALSPKGYIAPALGAIHAVIAKTTGGAA